jgi:hypothetical protein
LHHAKEDEAGHPGSDNHAVDASLALLICCHYDCFRLSPIQEQKPYSMSNDNDAGFRDRLSRAAEARRVMLTKAKQALDPDNPAVIEKRRQREAVVAARAERVAQRAAARQEQERELARQAALAAEAAAVAERIAAEQAVREAAEQAEREAALKAQQKAERDARYAARKAAKKERRLAMRN